MDSPGSVLSFWEKVELFLPFRLDDLLSGSRDCLLLALHEPVKLPWEDGSDFFLDPGWEYGFDVFIGIFPLQEILLSLAQRIPEIGYEQLPYDRSFRGISAAVRLSFDEKGKPLLGNTSISTLTYALEQFCNTGTCDVHFFDRMAQIVLGELEKTFCGDQDDEQIASFQSLVQCHHAIASTTTLRFIPSRHLALVIPVKLRKKYSDPQAEYQFQRKRNLLNPDHVVQAMNRRRSFDILNSFYLRELSHIGSSLQRGATSIPLTEYLSACTTRSPAGGRTDVRSDSSANWKGRMLERSHLIRGSWFSEKEQQLSANQTLAMTHYLYGEQGLTAINGAPGTGKTTLIKELSAHLIVSRAEVLATLCNPEDAFEQEQVEVKLAGGARYVRKLKAALTGFEIVVASSNNTAVENITLSMPEPNRDLQNLQSSYLRPVANLYKSHLHHRKGQKKTTSDHSWWGLPSAPLGKHSNRARLVKALTGMGRKEKKQERSARLQAGNSLTLLELLALRSYTDPLKKFQAAQEKFRILNERLEQLQTQPTQEQLKAQQRIDPLGCAPLFWETPEVTTIRKELLAAALHLHEAWLLSVPKLQSEILALQQLLISPHVGLGTEHLVLWQMLFLIVPVLSTTLASLGRMFTVLGPETLGHVIIDEAGQATPQSVCGALWRAKRCLLVGDQRQLKPIVLMGKTLESALSKELQQSTLQVISPLESSAQSIADLSSVPGTKIVDTYKIATWLAMPLLVHRRCADPMFSLANRMAYDNMMLQGNPGTPERHLLGPSCWWDIEGPVSEAQWVPEQGRFFQGLLDTLLLEETEKSIFVVTPFRRVASNLRRLVNSRLKFKGIDDRLRQRWRSAIGTVHTFQGREADVVICVLGCDKTTLGAVSWATAEPNMLNVAVTRARESFYILGDANLWGQFGYGAFLVDNLPRKNPYQSLPLYLHQSTGSTSV